MFLIQQSIDISCPYHDLYYILTYYALPEIYWAEEVRWKTVFCKDETERLHPLNKQQISRSSEVTHYNGHQKHQRPFASEIMLPWQQHPHQSCLWFSSSDSPNLLSHLKPLQQDSMAQQWDWRDLLPLRGQTTWLELVPPLLHHHLQHTESSVQHQQPVQTVKY